MIKQLNDLNRHKTVMINNREYFAPGTKVRMRKNYLEYNPTWEGILVVKSKKEIVRHHADHTRILNIPYVESPTEHIVVRITANAWTEYFELA